MFNGCSKLINIDLSNFDTSKVTTMERMLYNCKNLKYLDLSSFNISKLNNLYSMFRNCESLIYLNMKYFVIESPVNKTNTFKNICSYVKFCIEDSSAKNYLLGNDLTSVCDDSCFSENTKIDIINNICIDSCIDYGYQYEYNNICYHSCPNGSFEIFCEGNECDEDTKICFEKIPQSYYLDNNINKIKKCFKSCENCFGKGNETNNNCNKCISSYEFYISPINIKNCYPKCKYYYYFDKLNNYHCSESVKCPDDYRKLILNKKKCIDDCKNDDTYKFEKNNICYKENPYDTIQITTNFIYDWNKKTELIKEYNHNLSDFTIKIYTENILNSINNEIFVNNSIQDQILENIQELFHTGFNRTNIDKGNDLTIINSKVSYTITTTSNQKNNENNNVSTINLGECENKLKHNYNISKTDSLYILKVDALIDNIPKVEYEVYYPFTINNFTKLNLSICKNIKIEISIPIIINKDEIDKYNKSSGLYNDICYTLTSENGTDKILKDRQNDYKDNNISVCEEDCDFIDYDFNIKKAICSCFTKVKLPLISEIKVDKEKLYSNFKDIKNIGNFQLLKCRYLLFDLHQIFKNSANYIIVILLIVSIIALFSFICYNNLKIEKIIIRMSHEKEGNNENIKTIVKNNDITFKNNKLSKNKNIIKNKSKKNKILDNKINSLEKQKKNLNRYLQFSNINLNPISQNNLIINNNRFNKNKQSKNKKINFHGRNNRKKLSQNKNKYTKSNSNKFLNLSTKKHLNKNKKNLYLSKKVVLNHYNDKEMNSFDFSEAKAKDKRSYCQFYLSLLRTQHILIFTFCQFHDYNFQPIKIYLFFLTFAINYLISAMFYSESTMHKVYIDKGAFDFTYQLPIMFYSFLISTLLNYILNILGLYEQNIISFKKDKNKNLNPKKILSHIRFKIALFFIITYILLFLLWIYLGCFCAVYRNTQIHLLLEVSSSFGISFIAPFFIYLLPGLFRIPSLKSKNNRPLMYKFSKLLQLL